MADAATPQASALEQPRFWTLDRVADALGEGPRGPLALTRIATRTRARTAAPVSVVMIVETRSDRRSNGATATGTATGTKTGTSRTACCVSA